MKKYRPYFMIIFILLLFSSCGQEKAGKGKTLIIGNYFSSDSKLYLNRVYATKTEISDSVDLASDSVFTITVNSPDYALFRLEHNSLYPLIVVAKNGDTIRIEQTNDPGWPYNVTGNEECMMVASYLEKLNRDQYKVDSLSLIFHRSQSHPEFITIREQLNAEFIKIHEEHKAYAREFVTMHPSSFASLIMINSFFREFLLFDQDEDFNYYEMVANAVMEQMPENKYAIDLNDHVEKIRKANRAAAKSQKRLLPGKQVPEFELQTITGSMTGPQDYQKDILLIYFWAGTDAKSRQTNPMIRKIYETYHPSGLELMAISFDRVPEYWEAALKLDSLPGIHIHDPEGARSAVQKLFNLKMKLPAYFLIDKGGAIYNHDRDFSELQQQINELLDKQPEY